MTNEKKHHRRTSLYSHFQLFWLLGALFRSLRGPQRPRSPFLRLFLVSYSFSLFAASRERKRTAAASGRSCSAAYEQQPRYEERRAKKSKTSDGTCQKNTCRLHIFHRTLLIWVLLDREMIDSPLHC